MDCKKETKTRLRSNYSYYMILVTFEVNVRLDLSRKAMTKSLSPL